MDKTTRDYDELLRQFDVELANIIQKDVLTACFDVLWEQAYHEGYAQGQLDFYEYQAELTRFLIKKKNGVVAPFEELNYVYLPGGNANG